MAVIKGRGGVSYAQTAIGTRRAQPKRPSNGWFYLGQNSKGTNIWEFRPGSRDAAVRDASPPPSGGGGGGGGYGGGGGGAAPKGLSAYVQEYQLRFRTGAKPPPDLLKKAEAGNWSLAYFDQQIRLNDKTYFQSKEAKTVLPEFNRTMKVLFPGLADKDKQKALMQSSFYKKTAAWYLRNGIGLRQGGEEALYGRITNTGTWNKANPYWRDYARNKNIGVVSEANPMLYKSYLTTLQQNFQALGMELPEDYYKTFFRSRYASKSGIPEMQSNLKQIAEQGSSLGWWQGKDMQKSQVKEAAFGGKPDLRAKMSKAFGVRGSFLSGDQKGFDTQLSQQGKLVKPLI
jgi:hypothetical protein